MPKVNHSYQGVSVSRLYRASYNLIHTGNKYLWFNPVYDKDVQILRDLPHKINKRMHIFISHVNVVDDNFKKFITEFFYDPTNSPVLTIHIPGFMPDLKDVIQDMVNTMELAGYGPTPRVRVVCEHQPVRFGIPGWAGTPLKVTFEEDKLQVSVDITDREIGGYRYEGFRGFGGKPGAVKNLVQAQWPHVFKDRIISCFKDTCPAGILKSFKTDDEIWEYIMQTGEWDPKNGEGK